MNYCADILACGSHDECPCGGCCNANNNCDTIENNACPSGTCPADGAKAACGKFKTSMKSVILSYENIWKYYSI